MVQTEVKFIHPTNHCSTPAEPQTVVFDGLDPAGVDKLLALVRIAAPVFG